MDEAFLDRLREIAAEIDATDDYHAARRLRGNAFLSLENKHPKTVAEAYRILKIEADDDDEPDTPINAHVERVLYAQWDLAMSWYNDGDYGACALALTGITRIVHALHMKRPASEINWLARDIDPDRPRLIG